MQADPSENTRSAERPIGIFDSGIGGLTVASQVMKMLPQESLVYFGDTARVPYGTKSDRTVREFAWEDSLFLLWHDVKMLVVACNTASAIALDELDRHLKVPVIGVIKPGVEAAVSATRSGSVGVIGTRATIESRAYEKEIHRLNPDITTHTITCPLFVPLAEEGWLSGDIPERVARHYLQPLQQAGIDTLILGCTHYPLLKPLLNTVLGDKITLVDSAFETAKRVSELLHEQNILGKNVNAQRHFFVSDLPRRFEEVGQRFLGEPIGNVSIAEPWKGSRPYLHQDSP